MLRYSSHRHYLPFLHQYISTILVQCLFEVWQIALSDRWLSIVDMRWCEGER